MLAIPILIFIIIGYTVLIYNRLVTLKTRINASIQEIGNQLKRQADLIPGLIDSVKGYMKHEKTIFEQLFAARKMANEAVTSNQIDKIDQASNELQKVFGQLKILVENTPELKAVVVVNQLMEELRDTADKLMYARRTLIDLTADYNTSVVTFPSNLIAMLFKFTAEKGLTMPAVSVTTVSAEDTKTPEVKLD